MSENMLEKIDLGLSPCPNDTFIFHALLHGLVKVETDTPISFRPVMADVEKLNAMALKSELQISKVSLGVVPHILGDYRILSTGGALGWGCGPLLVARKKLSAAEMEKAAIAIPGSMTTANMLLGLHGGFQGERVEMLFSDIMGAVESGDVDAGVIIHEGRFTYQEHNLEKVLDMGEWWEARHRLPLPLGAIVIRRDVPLHKGLAVQQAIAGSLRHAWLHPEDSRQFVRDNAREISEDVIRAHIRTFVTRFSEDLGGIGKKAIFTLAGSAQENGPIHEKEIFLE